MVFACEIMDLKRKYILFAIIIIIAIIGFNTFIIVCPSHDYPATIAIIDVCCSEKHDTLDIEYAFDEGVPHEHSQDTHGDLLLDFLEKMEYGGKVYYYNVALDSVTTEDIENGLNWAKANRVSCVNISQSSTIYSESLQQWIRENHDTVVYASYNNLLNTWDYPAMYDGVIGCTKRNMEISYKKIDRLYRTNHLLVLNKGIHIYDGNSFLSLLTALNP